ncbi:unnamed protein product [Soboliphyme baturini]|uniref:SAP domain-containing protein n=1 Tax=Soboliphyme baturini TaxID=241478 RepID=A0A183J0I1_9BILA|nr:unnamed protein product [Soboliphyme baturini]
MPVARRTSGMAQLYGCRRSAAYACKHRVGGAGMHRPPFRSGHLCRKRTTSPLRCGQRLLRTRHLTMSAVPVRASSAFESERLLFGGFKHRFTRTVAVAVAAQSRTGRPSGADDSRHCVDGGKLAEAFSSWECASFKKLPIAEFRDQLSLCGIDQSGDRQKLIAATAVSKEKKPDSSRRRRRWLGGRPSSERLTKSSPPPLQYLTELLAEDDDFGRRNMAKPIRGSCVGNMRQGDR